ncbi:hypothetical protein ACUX17_23820, partial [Salmonella enterica]
VPAYGPQNDVTLKMPAFEWVHVQLHQQKGMISLSPPTICNSAVNFNGVQDLTSNGFFIFFCHFQILALCWGDSPCNSETYNCEQGIYQILLIFYLAQYSTSGLFYATDFLRCL